MKRKTFSISTTQRRPLAIVVALVVGTAGTPALAGDSGPFQGLNGRWAGQGVIRMGSGATERIQCRAAYATGDEGKGLQQTLVCASDSYKFEVNSNVVQQGDSLSGTWTELARNTSGNISGRAVRGKIDARVNGGPFSATLSVTTNNNRQSVIIRPQGTDVAEVQVTLTRSGG